jgi:nitrogen-specific signal transduction histidine kinase/CheY-like chemotaxis protein
MSKTDSMGEIVFSDNNICQEFSLSSLDVAKYVMADTNMNEQSRQIQKLEAIGRVAGSVAHDFNNILAAIASYTEIALSSIDEGAIIKSDLVQIQKAIEYGRTLTKQLLTFSHQEPVKSQIMELNAVISDFESLMRQLTGESIDLVLDLKAKSDRVKIDAGRIEQIVMNLVVNARDAMPNGGKLTIETKNICFDPDYATQCPEVSVGEYVVIIVTDTGIGMSKTTLSHVFEPFYSTKGENGTGLGLATVYGIVKQHNGHVRVYSEINAGTTFKIYLPLAEPKNAPQVVKDELPKPEFTTVLVVEDDPVVRPIIGKILQKHGYKVIEAQSGEEALEISRAKTSHFDLVVTDVTLPGISGVEFASQVKEYHPDVPFIFCSGYTELGANERHLLPAEAEFIEKPFTPSQLIEKISKLKTKGFEAKA